MFTNHRPWLRHIMEPSDEGGAAAATPPEAPAPSSEDHSGEDSGTDQPTGGPDAGDQGDADNGDAAGTDNTDALSTITAERDALAAQVEEFKRAQMTESEKVTADRDKAIAERDEALAKVAQIERDRIAVQACRDAGIPEGMAPRLSGTNRDEITADAKALAESIGYDRGPVDPSQGKGTAGGPAHRSLGDALSAHYGTGARR